MHAGKLAGGAGLGRARRFERCRAEREEEGQENVFGETFGRRNRF